MKFTMFRAGCSLAILALAMGSASAATIRIAEHRQARIDALNASIPAIEAKLGVDIEVVEYPAPEKDYFSKLLTELGAGNAPDLFTANNDADVPDLVAAGYVADITAAVQGWDGYPELLDVVKRLSTMPDGKMYQLDSMLSVSQLYYRRDILDAAGISTEQPKSWAELLDRVREIKAKTGKYGLLLPAGTTWGGGAFYEGVMLMLVGTSTPQILNADGTLDLTGKGITDVLGFYKTLIDEDLMPIDPLLGPEPWVIPKYEMFPAGELVATTCGAWCYIYDWGPESKNPIPDVTKAVGTWAVPNEDGSGSTVTVGGQSIWMVNAKGADTEMATKVLLELSAVQPTVEYAKRLGNIPARRDALDNADFQALPELVPVLQNAESGTYLQSGEGFSAVSEGFARATEALLRKETDAAGAQQILIDYTRDLLGDEMVK
jgi:multiple sugar transport system substrate-binding protein